MRSMQGYRISVCVVILLCTYIRFLTTSTVLLWVVLVALAPQCSIRQDALPAARG
jgi:hypothetical protein